MSLVEYHLYRAKFIHPSQRDMFIPRDTSSAQLFIAAINEKPEVTLKKDNVWHIGNIERFDEMSGSFAIGRTTKTTVERFDPITGNFIDLPDDAGPYTAVLFDASIGLLGIAKKSKVASDVASIARKIERLFSNCKIVMEYGLEVKVDYIPDPEGFIQKLRAAYSIKKFKATFTGPNPIDADEIFQKPLSVYCREVNGDHGHVEVVGEQLNEETLEAVAKSTAATANTASARIQPNSKKRFMTIRMKGDALRIPIDPETPKREILIKIQKAYYKVRG